MSDKKKWLYETESHSELYKRFRFKHPQSIFHFIRSKLTEATLALPPPLQKEYGPDGNGRWKKALDVGCGTGLSTIPLTDFIQETFAIDKSSSQIQQATIEYGNKDPSRVTFLQADITQVSSMFPEGAFDLVTVGVAAHWMLQDGLFDTVKRLLRCGGVLVSYSYNGLKIQEPEACVLLENYMKEFVHPWFEEEAWKAVMDPGIVLREMAKYFPGAQKDESMLLGAEMTVEEIKGFYSSLTSYQKFLRSKKPGESDPLEELSHRLRALGDKFLTTIPYNVLFATKSDH